MAGMFDWLFPSQTQGDASVPVSGDAGQAAAGGSGWGSQISDALAQNRQSMIGFGLGLMSGDSKGDAYRNALLGAQRGVVLDAATAKEKKADEEKKKRQIVYQQLAAKYGIPAELATGDPETFQTALAQRLKPDEGQIIGNAESGYFRVFQNGTKQPLIGGTPDKSNSQKVYEWIKTLPPEQQQEAMQMAGVTPKQTVNQQQAILKAEDQIPQLDSTIQTLERAKQLNPKVGKGAAFAPGVAPGVRAKVANRLGYGNADDVATEEWGNTMSMEAIQSMSQSLKGSTTDFELQKFVDILGDPSTPEAVRGKVIDRMLQLAKSQKELSQKRATGIREGTYFKAGQGGGSEADPVGLR